MSKRYNSYSDYLKNKFGCRVHKVSVDMGFTCPNRDGTLARGGCIYCNNDSFVPPYARARYTMSEQITHGVRYLKDRYNAKKFIVYFQAYTSTYDSVERLEKLYREALGHDSVVGLAIGTRSDCVNGEIIGLLQTLARDHYVAVEYGIESIYDKTLSFMNRGHDYQSVVDAIRLTKHKNIEIGAHVIVGMPTETRSEMLEMATEVSALGIDNFKIHNLHIVKNTPLARMYMEQPFPLFSYEEYLEFITEFLELLSPEIVIERLFTDTPQDLLIAPKWDQRHNEIIMGIQRELERKQSYQGKRFVL